MGRNVKVGAFAIANQRNNRIRLNQLNVDRALDEWKSVCVCVRAGDFWCVDRVIEVLGPTKGSARRFHPRRNKSAVEEQSYMAQHPGIDLRKHGRQELPNGRATTEY